MAKYSGRTERALTSWARGRLTAKEVKVIMLQEGLKGDLRDRSVNDGYIELFPIGGGKAVKYSFNKGGLAKKKR